MSRSKFRSGIAVPIASQAVDTVLVTAFKHIVPGAGMSSADGEPGVSICTRVTLIADANAFNASRYTGLLIMTKCQTVFLSMHDGHRPDVI
jgi:hypothetical protein